MIKHFIDINSLSKKEIFEIIDLAIMFKKAKKDEAIPQILKGKSLAMIFELPSSRTRVSFENAMTLLGGHALYLKPGEIHLGSREILEDTSKVLSRLCDGIFMRAWEHNSIIELSNHATVPVFNGLSDYNHPTQALADVMTIIENIDKDIKDIDLTFIGDRTNVCNSLLNISMKLGMGFKQIGPKKYHMKKEVIEEAVKANPKYKKSILITDNMKYIKGTDIIYTDLWWWIDQEVEKEIRKNAFMDKYQVNIEKLNKTKNPNIKFMHCLPANREMEVTSEVLDGENSLAFMQTENRLYIQMALLSHYMYQQKQLSSDETIKKHKEDIYDQLKRMTKI
ncbi:MAG: Putrescine carbamoyltransferase [Candidatus Izimaplasma bacterium HR2]|nr:MAG: Putrescine carbamoyltransferase [Candidatus Izimaplasma bacterium HR2]